MLLAAVAADSDAALNSSGVLAHLAEAGPGLAQRVAEAPGVLLTLVAAGADDSKAAWGSAMALGNIAKADPGLTQRVAETPGALPALIAAVKAGGCAAERAGQALEIIRSWAEAAAAAAGTACFHCGRTAGMAPGVHVRVCTGCHTTRFCNMECQRRAWGTHKAACRALAAISGARHATHLCGGAPPARPCLCA